ncbi:peptidase M1, membrane alanine aminopeptidase [Metallosphaera sedula]|uniref:Aminopeptidase n=3 Tax=Metallosphaera TaxID=41980 RepID=A4YE98_METS5|nr:MULTISPECIES: M1 family metallopeptidase [Metallosphaera]ABP94750.1 peptidase M1, membrane alanine aminopeptidase [Metallosphaera sedula DSM 5348]AIM26737.1 peptidase M1, membrane alanine aminopeptidase [Metallosphaera sedula]AKV73693.1 leucyl aminopeptidase [Metallosphaera sedula]AKV75933.1 leucyl aminopeptidase [Metallosphaera sedula]AKV78184.1 leucyl aminopeptidase [Metallosphaera sedula]
MKINSYDIHVIFNFKESTYKGTEIINLDTEDGVELDAVGLEIHSVEIDGRSADFKLEDNKVKVKTGKFSGDLRVTFSGKVRDTLVGIYRAPYNGSYMFSTQFESSHAREFIPCVDHPAYKAKFRLSVTVDRGLQVISNMPVKETREEGDQVTYVFHETPPMSTYLLYVGVGKFEEFRLQNVPEIIVATVPGKISKAKLPAEFARDFIRKYEEYYGIKYQLPKVHLIAVPEFAFGAMENWGAITFRETALLADEKSGFSNIRRVAEVVAHELAHQWFGNLVTMKWWNDLWLNESFATFMSYKIIDMLHPEWYMWGEFLLDETAGALLKDSIPTTHPIETKVNSPEEVEQIFDDISYGKGASILRMIESYIGKDEFRRGISKYLQKFSYGNAEGKDLWNSLEEASGKPVSKIMPHWVLEDGYPMVKVQIVGNQLELTQERFGLHPVPEKTYPIPITLMVNGEKKDLVMEGKSVRIEVGHVNELKVNLDKAGFYRVMYFDLGPVLASELTPEEQWGLANDYFAFLLAGKVSRDEYFKVVRSLMSAKHHLPVLELADQLSFLYAVNSQKYGEIAREFHSKQVKEWSTRQDPVGRRTYSTLAMNLSKMDPKFATSLSAQFSQYDQLDGDLKSAVAIAYAVSAGSQALDQLLTMYRQSKFDEDKTRLLNALLSMNSPHSVVNVLSMVFTGEMKKQDIIRSLQYSLFYPNVRDAVWEWIKIHSKKVAEIYQGTGIFGRVMADVIPLLGIGRVEEVERFFEANPIKGAEKGIRQGIEILKAVSRIV